jgi:hypothetical protein
MSHATTKTDRIDNYIAKQYLALRRGEGDSFTARLLSMGEEARVIDKAGQEILQEAARKMAEWELANE